MQTASMNLAIQDVVESVHDVERMPRYFYLGAFLDKIFWLFFGARIQHMSQVSAQASDRMRLMLLEVTRETKSDLLDPDMELRDSLDRLKKSVDGFRQINSKMIPDMHTLAGKKSRCAKALQAADAMMGQLYAAATELQWALAEHDADHAPRLGGYTAKSADELGALLDRIAAGK